MFRTVFNPSDAAVTASTQGHVIGGGEWDAVNSTDEVAKEALKSEWLVLVDIPEDATGLNPAAWAARAKTIELQDRHDKLSAASKETLTETAKQFELIDNNDSPNKTELVDLLTYRREIPVPEAEEEPKASKSTGKAQSTDKTPTTDHKEG